MSEGRGLVTSMNGCLAAAVALCAGLAAVGCGAAPLPPESPAVGHPEAVPPVEVIISEPVDEDAALQAPVPKEPPVEMRLPERIDEALVDRHIVASGLPNPRGMLPVDGGLLVAVAGTGDPENPNTGALVRLVDRDGDGDFLDAAEVRPLLRRQPSKNILGIVRRDEVFGMAAVAEGGDQIVATLAFFGGPSTVFQIAGDKVEPLGDVHGNLNDLVFHPKLGKWFAVSSSSDEVLVIDPPKGRGDRLVKLQALGGGQDPVPGYLDVDPTTGDLLVSLFSGSTEGEAGGEGTELVVGAGSIVRVDPDSGAVSPYIQGLTAPTDLLVGQRYLYVLEFCDAFLEPIGTRAGLSGEPRHGGFKRFSGRLLRVDRASGDVRVVAKGLDGPTNLAVADGKLYIAQGMGTPGRLIPGPNGPRSLDGFIEVLELPEAPPQAPAKKQE